jgi:hypothetical protein
MRRTALVLLTAAVLGTVLTGCEEKEILVDRVNQGQRAEDAVQGAQEIDQAQSEEVGKYLGE